MTASAVNKKRRQVLRDELQMRAEKGGAALATVMPGATVTVDLVKIGNGERRLGFLITLPSSGDSWVIDGIDNLHAMNMDKVRPYLAGVPRQVKTAEGRYLRQGRHFRR